MKRFFTQLANGMRQINKPRPATSHERRPILRLEEMEPRVLMNGAPINGFEVKEDTKYLSHSSFEGPQTAYSPASLAGAGINYSLQKQLEFDFNAATGNGQLNSQIQQGLSKINSKLPSGFSLYNIQANPPQADDTNSNLDATINSDNSVKLDFIVHGLSGSFSSRIPDWVNYIYWGIVGPLSWGSPVPDPQFSFTADVDLQINLPAPSKGPTALGQPSLSITVTNMHYSGDNITGDIAQVANDIFNFMPSSEGVGNPGSLAARFIDNDFQPLASGLQQAAKFGATQFRVQIAADPQNGVMLEYLADKPVNLPSNMSLEPQSSNNPLGNWLAVAGDPFNSQLTLDTASGGIQLVVNGQTTNFAPGAVAYVHIGDGNLTDTVTVQGGAAALLPGGVNVWGAKSFVIDDTADPSSMEYEISGSKEPYVISGEVDANSLKTTSHFAITYQDIGSVTLDGGNHGNLFVVDENYIPLTIYTGTGTNYVYPGDSEISTTTYGYILQPGAELTNYGGEAPIIIHNQGSKSIFGGGGGGDGGGYGGGGGGGGGGWGIPPSKNPTYPHDIM